MAHTALINTSRDTVHLCQYRSLHCSVSSFSHAVFLLLIEHTCIICRASHCTSSEMPRFDVPLRSCVLYLLKRCISYSYNTFTAAFCSCCKEQHCIQCLQHLIFSARTIISIRVGLLFSILLYAFCVYCFYRTCCILS